MNEQMRLGKTENVFSGLSAGVDWSWEHYSSLSTGVAALS